MLPCPCANFIVCLFSLFVFFGKVSSSLRQFTVQYKSYISGSDNQVVSNSDPESCASSCLSQSSFVCRSFDFDNSSNTCSMSKESTLKSALTAADGHRYFELSKAMQLQYILALNIGDTRCHIVSHALSLRISLVG